MSTTKCVIRIDENGPRVESNGNIVASDLRLTLKDYLPEVTNWTTWNGTLNEGDEINITTPYKFIAVRARNKNTSSGSTITPSTGPDLISACLPANNSLASNCGCNASSGEDLGVLLDFEMNQYTTYTLDTKTIYSNNTLIFDCSNGATATGVTGWTGCTLSDTLSCGGTGATGATGAIGITGGIGATCDVGSTAGATAAAKGVYEYAFVGVLDDNNLVIKTSDAECDYKCKLDYYAYTKADNDYILFIFDNTAGKWVLVKFDQKISEVVANKTPFNIIELIEWSETSYTYENSNITMPSTAEGATGATGVNSYAGTVTELDGDMPVTFKMNSLFIMESATFTGKITSKLNNLDVNVLLAV